MPDPSPCPTCGRPLPEDATGGACPRCLLEAAFETGGTPSDEIPSIGALAPHFPGLVLERVLGRGGMGVVYKARHRTLDRDVALKVLPARLAADRAFAERFQREARALAKLQHPNIVQIHDCGETDGLLWLVMEYVDGVNLRQALRAGTISSRDALSIVPQVCDALQYAHDHGVVHRDIKPENVLLDGSGRVKVADFGLAKIAGRGPSAAALTRAGEVMGTPRYMAPEQFVAPSDVDHRADIYSLGVVFYEMLTGEVPMGRFAPPSLKAAIDARIDEIVLRTLAREREARYQQAVDVKTAVTDVAATPGPACAARSQIAGPRHELVVGACLSLTGAIFWATHDAGVAWLLLPLAGLALMALAVWHRLRTHAGDLPAGTLAWGAGVIACAAVAVVPGLAREPDLRAVARIAGAAVTLAVAFGWAGRRRSAGPARGVLDATVAVVAGAALLAAGVAAFMASTYRGSERLDGKPVYLFDRPGDSGR